MRKNSFYFKDPKIHAIGKMNELARESIARYFGHPLQDFAKGTWIRKAHKDLLISQQWPLEKLQSLQLAKLKKLVAHAYSENEYYREIFNNLALNPADIKTLTDLSILPVMDKQKARNAGEKLFGTNRPPKNVIIGKTGGTTGVPLYYKKDAQTRSIGWGAYFRWRDWMGVNREFKSVSLWGAPTVTSINSKEAAFNNFKNYLLNMIKIDSFNINNDTLPDISKSIEKHNPKILTGYLSALLQLAYFLEETGNPHIRPLAVSSTTETLLPPYRALLEKVFQAPVFDQYGCGECGSIAFECSAHEGLHITSEHCIVEILDENGQDAGLEVGDIVVTDLDNYAMPFIRYKNGDRGRWAERACSCGMAHPLLAEISGRTADTIVLSNGSKVHGVFFTDIVGELNLIQERAIRRFQAYQNEPGCLEFRVESDTQLPKEDEEKLMRIFNRFFTSSEIKYFSKLENSKSGKFRYVVSEIV